jgi:hypothetical protein
MPEKIKKTLTQRLSPIIDRYSPQLMKELIAVDPKWVGRKVLVILK